ncbi:putative phosphatidate phosphatase isoform X1 [Uranotaenia lowii]|uniref:putative phosphatidate phosphatase isoform X1 n=1 Tax=Uranotaenia lowii TaxID=190385 RepID=UPI002479FBBB|nr:putative phosphatidate phosphatase isoform X1 [Uranotaenia lowii]
MADVESLSRFDKPSRLRMSLPSIFDVTTVGLVISFIVICNYGWFPWVTKRGFYCDDRSIQRPFTGDTITAKMIIISGFVPLFLIWLTEAIFYTPSSLDCTKTGPVQTRCRESFRQSWYWFKKYARVLILKLLIVDVIKVLVGEHRPHFLDTCKPNVVCEGSEYVSTYVCTNTEDKSYFIRDASKSFPSGHSSTSVYAVVFVIWYLQRRVPKMRSCMALLLCQTAVGIWALVCSLSRIFDNRHHWWDVLAGSIIGLIAGILTCYLGCQNFNKARQRVQITSYKDHDVTLIGNNSISCKDDGVLHNTIMQSTQTGNNY